MWKKGEELMARDGGGEVEGVEKKKLERLIG